jgi:hypothetical protein
MRHRTSWDSGLLSFDEAEDRLKRGTFYIYLGRARDDEGVLCDWFGTGFFVSIDGLAMTADHNPRPYGKTHFQGFYKGSPIRLKWIRK